MNTPRRNGFDLDDTLIEFTPAFLKFYNQEYGTNHEKREFHNYRFWEILGGTRDRMTQIIHEFHETDFAKMATAIHGAREVIQNLHNAGYENYIITSRPDYIQPHTQAIIENLFDGYIKDIYFANHFSMRGTPKKKSEICAYLGLDNITEDSLEYAEDCAQVVPKVLLLNQPWNQGETSGTNIIRVNDWREIENFLK